MFSLKRSAAMAASAACVVLLSLSGVEAHEAASESGEGTILQVGPDGPRPTHGRPHQPGFRDGPGWQNQLVVLSRYWIGISAGPVSPELRSHLDLPNGEGVLVRQVSPESPAEEEGVELYDVVTRVNGKPIATVADLAALVAEQGERKGRLTLDLVRKAQQRTVWVTPAERPLQPQVEAPPRRQPFDRWERSLREGIGEGNGLQERFLEMEEQVQSLRRQFPAPGVNEPPLIDPDKSLEAAPPFEPAQPSEVEIPTDVQ